MVGATPLVSRDVVDVLCGATGVAVDVVALSPELLRCGGTTSSGSFDKSTSSGGTDAAGGVAISGTRIFSRDGREAT